MSMSRRQFGLSGVGAGLALAAPGSAWPQEGRAAPPVEVETPEGALALQALTNQVTRMAVEASVDGQGPYSFIIDTGAERTSVSAELAERLALPPGPDVMVHGVAGPERTRSVRIDRFRLGAHEFQDLHAPVFPRQNAGVAGLVGIDVLQNFRLVFDVRNSEVLLGRASRGSRGATIATGGSDFTTGSRLLTRTTLRGRRYGRQLIISEVQAEGIPVDAFIDSGAQYSVGNMALWRSVAARRPSLSGDQYTVPLIGVTGQQVTGRIAQLASLRLGRTTVRDVAAVFADLHAFSILGLTERPALLLGADVIGLFQRVLVDFGTDEVRFGSLRRAPRNTVTRASA